jgi:hypothetical protein
MVFVQRIQIAILLQRAVYDITAAVGEKKEDLCVELKCKLKTAQQSAI